MSDLWFFFRLKIRQIERKLAFFRAFGTFWLSHLRSRSRQTHALRGQRLLKLPRIFPSIRSKWSVSILQMSKWNWKSMRNRFQVLEKLQILPIQQMSPKWNETRLCSQWRRTKNSTPKTNIRILIRILIRIIIRNRTKNFVTSDFDYFTQWQHDWRWNDGPYPIPRFENIDVLKIVIFEKMRFSKKKGISEKLRFSKKWHFQQNGILQIFFQIDVYVIFK